MAIGDELSNAEVDRSLVRLEALGAKVELELFKLFRSVMELARERELDEPFECMGFEDELARERELALVLVGSSVLDAGNWS